MKSCGSEICVKRIRVNQGVGVFCWLCNIELQNLGNARQHHAAQCFPQHITQCCVAITFFFLFFSLLHSVVVTLFLQFVTRAAKICYFVSYFLFTNPPSVSCFCQPTLFNFRSKFSCSHLNQKTKLFFKFCPSL